MTYGDAPDACHHMMMALQRRSIIGAAEGILMERHKIDQRAAHQLLVAAADTSRRTLEGVARRLATTGDLNPPRVSGRSSRMMPTGFARERGSAARGNAVDVLHARRVLDQP